MERAAVTADARAAIDVGTNSVRLLIVDGDREIRRSVVTGLGRGLDGCGRISEDAIERTVDVLARYAAEMGGIARARAVSTSAARDAANRRQLIERAEEALGRPLEVISGTEEAELSYRGATSDVTAPDDVVVSDIGGGSTEFVWRHASEPRGVSVDMGSVRLTDRLFESRPVPFDTLQRAVAMVERSFDGVSVPLSSPRLIAVAGTWTTLAAMVDDARPVHGRILVRAHIEQLLLRLAASTVEETARLPGLDPDRAPVILGGAVVAREVMRKLGVTEASISERDLLDGIVHAL